jgi:prepilin-type N-terminal cleavage/methylation domain-containing protein
MGRNRIIGFSLAELLITLGILGILAAFTVPKLLNPPNNSLNSKQSAMAKDVAFMISSAYEQYRMANASVPTSTTPGALTSYMSYVKLDTSGATVDAVPTITSVTCSSSTPCLKLHNGGTLYFSSEYFAGSNTTNCIQLVFDPNGVPSGSTADSPGKSVQFEIYYDGKITTRGTARASSCHSATCTLWA